MEEHQTSQDNLDSVADMKVDDPIEIKTASIMDYLNFISPIFNVHGNMLEQFSVQDEWNKSGGNLLQFLNSIPASKLAHFTTAFTGCTDILEECRKAACTLDLISSEFSNGVSSYLFDADANHVWGIWKLYNGHAGKFLAAIGADKKAKIVEWLTPLISSKNTYCTQNPIFIRPLVEVPVRARPGREKRGIRSTAMLSAIYFGEAAPQDVPNINKKVGGHAIHSKDPKAGLGAPARGGGVRGSKQLEAIYYAN